MTQIVFIIFFYWYYCSSIIVQSHFEVIENDGKISMDNELQERDTHPVNKSMFLKSRHKKFPYDFRSSYPPSVPYLIWLKNNKEFPDWVYQMVRSKYRDDNLEWRINELSKLYKKCDMITGGFPLSGIYIKHLLELINLQKRIDDRSIKQDIDTKEDLDNLRRIQLPKANNLSIRLHLRDEEKIMKKVDPIGYLKTLAIRNPSMRNSFCIKYLPQDYSSIGERKILKDFTNQRSGRLLKRSINNDQIINTINVKFNTSGSRIHSTTNGSPPIAVKLKNIVDLIEDPGLNISTNLREELRQLCMDYLKNYLDDKYNMTNIISTELKKLLEGTDNNKKHLDQTAERIGSQAKKGNKKIDKFLSEDDIYKNRNYRIHVSASKVHNEGKKRNETAGDEFYKSIKSSIESKPKERQRTSKFSDFVENTKFYKKIRKEFLENNLLSKYDLVDVLENIGYNLPKESKSDLTYLYGELLKKRQRSRLKKVFKEENYCFNFPDIKDEVVIDMLTSLMLVNINNRWTKNRASLANVLENLGFNMTRGAKKKINKLYRAKLKTNFRPESKLQHFNFTIKTL